MKARRVGRVMGNMGARWVRKARRVMKVRSVMKARRVREYEHHKGQAD